MPDKVSIRDVYGAALKKLGQQEERVVVLEADVGGSTKSAVFGKAFPDRYFNVGIAELNMAAMAAGFAYAGKIPFVNTFSVFLTTRASDPISSMIAYDHLNVKLCGAYSGLSDAYDGASHHGIFDMAFVRSLPGMTILSVCDPVETEKAVFAAAEIEGPVYLRLSRAEAPVLYSEDMVFTPGKGILLRAGADVSLLATGLMVHHALEAAGLLEAEGISARVVDLHTVQPVDRELVLESAEKTGCIVTAEEHSIRGGLGSAVAEVLAQGRPTIQEFVGLDSYTESGAYGALLTAYHLDAQAIAEKARLALQRKKA